MDSQWRSLQRAFHRYILYPTTEFNTFRFSVLLSFSCQWLSLENELHSPMVPLKKNILFLESVASSICRDTISESLYKAPLNCNFSSAPQSCLCPGVWTQDLPRGRQCFIIQLNFQTSGVLTMPLLPPS